MCRVFHFSFSPWTFTGFDIYQQSVLVIFLGVSGYTNYDAFEYTEAPTVQEQSNSVLSNTFYGFLNCTTTMRDELFGLDQRSAAFSLAALDIDGLIDLYAYGIPDGATVMAQSLANATLSLASDCLGNSVSPVSHSEVR